MFTAHCTLHSLYTAHCTHYTLYTAHCTHCTHCPLHSLSTAHCTHYGSTEALTPLGTHLANLPVAPRIGKLMVFGVLLRCTESILTVCAFLSSRSPFLNMQRRDEQEVQAVEAERRSLMMAHSNEDEMQGDVSHSDHLLLARVYTKWRDANERSPREGRSFCVDHGLSMEGMHRYSILTMPYTLCTVLTIGRCTGHRSCAGSTPGVWWRSASSPRALSRGVGGGTKRTTLTRTQDASSGTVHHSMHHTLYCTQGPSSVACCVRGSTGMCCG
jgi:hypothetical protein